MDDFHLQGREMRVLEKKGQVRVQCLEKSFGVDVLQRLEADREAIYFYQK